MNKKELPHVAVIISNYNYGEFVLEAIDSALNQDYPNLEVIVIDDASTDDSVERIYQHSLFELTGRGRNTQDASYFSINYGDKQLTLITLKENGKQGRARNFGIREAWDRADYFLILDGDDTIMPNKVSRFVEKFLEFKDAIGSVHGDYYIFNTTDGTVTEEYKPPYNQNLLRYDCHLHSGGMISKKAFEFAGLFDTDVCPKEDYLQWLKISEGFICVHIPEFLSYVKVSPKNTTDSLSEEFHKQQYQLMAERFQEFLQQKNKKE